MADRELIRRDVVPVGNGFLCPEVTGHGQVENGVCGKGRGIEEESDMLDRGNEKAPRAILRATFDARSGEDVSGYGNHGLVVGDPEYGEGFDGGWALCLNNPFGRNAAARYVRFEELKGIDLTTEDFTVMCWYRTVCGGTQEWAASWHVCQAGWGVDMPGVLLGGVVFSNRDTFDFDATGILAAQLPLDQYFAVGLTGERGVRRDVDGIWEPQDSRWHQIAVTCSRGGGRYAVYVDGEEKASADISAFAGQRIGSNTLVLGADLLGQYGLGNAWVDSFEVYAGALECEEIRGSFRLQRVRQLAAEVGKRLESCGRIYSPEGRERLAEEAERTLAQLDLPGVRASAEKQEQLYETLEREYEAFLAEPQKRARLSMLLISDLHIREEADACAAALERVFADLEAWDAKLDGILNPGDFAAGATEKVCDTAYGVIDRLMEKHDDWQLISCFGNHETNYVSPEENYDTGAGAFWRNVQRHISPGRDRRFGHGRLDSVQNYSYGMTLKGFHFLVLNTDYLPQTGDGRTDWDTNALDPIRHGLFLSEESYAWLARSLEEYAGDGQPIFVISHSPFADTVPLSYFRRIRIRDNSVGPQDSRLRRLLGRYPGVVYVCGHLHLNFGVTGPVTVESTEGGRFTEITLPSLKNSTRAYRSVPSSWIMYVYEEEIVLRARDFRTGRWIPAYDEVIRLRE